MNSAVERAIKFICERYSEPLSLGDIADSAIMSRFHFCRTFGSATGVTPGRFLSAVRIYQAKRMLVNTHMNVTDIAFAVGYNSLGSFSNHFTDSVGVSPGRFRRISRSGGFELPRTPTESSSLDSTVTGRIIFPRGYAGARVYLGAFDTPIIQRRPAAALVVEAATPRSVPFRLTGVRQGAWFLRAVAVADNSDPDPWTRRVLLVGGSGQVRATCGATVSAQIELRPKRATDLPILLAIPELEFQLEDLPAAKARLDPIGALHVT
jgi:AraC family transcriptional regulator